MWEPNQELKEILRELWPDASNGTLDWWLEDALLPTFPRHKTGDWRDFVPDNMKGGSNWGSQTHEEAVRQYVKANRLWLESLKEDDGKDSAGGIK